MDVRRSDAALDSYVQAKQAVAQLLRETRQLLDVCGAGGGERLHELLSRLAADQFHLVVLGQFKRGKSSLINAVIGQDLLPVAAVPLTSVLTALRYGPRERAVLQRRGFVLPQEIPLNELADYITERGNPRNEKGVHSAEIEVPVPFLRRGLRFIDTPGIGSIHEHNTATTYAFLPQADAAIFVTSADSPLTDAELQFLDTIRQHVRKIIFVVNKIDQLDAAECDEVLSFMRRELARRLGLAAVQLYPLSAREALAAKQQSNAQRLAASGLPAFEAALAEFLSVERGAVFLTALLERALRLLDSARFALDLDHAARIQPEPALRGRVAQFERRFQQLEQARASLIADIRARLETWRSDTLRPELSRMAGETAAALAAELEQLVEHKRDLGADDLFLELRNWMRTYLAERGTSWLTDLRPQLDELVRTYLGAAQPRVTELVAETTSAAASIFELSGSRESAAAAEEVESALRTPSFDVGRAWRQAGYRLQRDDDVAPMAPLPDRFARRLVLRSIRAQVEPEVEHLAGALEKTTFDHLKGSISTLDVQSSALLNRARERLVAGLPATTETPAPVQPSSVLDTDPAEQRATLTELTERIARLRDALAAGTVPEDTLESVLKPAARDMQQRRRQDLSDVAAPAVPEQLDDSESCPICFAEYTAVYEFLCQFQYQIATDGQAQEALRDSGGLCAAHTWQLEALASPRGLSSGYASLVQQVARQLERAVGLPAVSARERVGGLLPAEERCPVCRVRDRAQSAALQRLAEQLSRAGVPETLSRSDGLCLPHLYLLLGVIEDHTASAVLRHQARRLSDLTETMHRYVLGIEARRRDLLIDGDDRAYLKGLVFLVGEMHLG